jgi:hypothetical protein
LKKNFGRNTTVNSKTITTLTTRWRAGTCAKKSTNTEYGVMKIAETLIHFALTNGPTQIFSY